LGTHPGIRGFPGYFPNTEPNEFKDLGREQPIRRRLLYPLSYGRDAVSTGFYRCRLANLAPCWGLLLGTRFRVSPFRGIPYHTITSPGKSAR